ncbi:MAG: SusC/RagA family TonB-linked outer membrane protein [Bacteroidaceae bacterium]|nr:SusC/RagA family TonB-linked outer membrane protein [Bacteroidaceae bacterium]
MKIRLNKTGKSLLPIGMIGLMLSFSANANAQAAKEGMTTIKGVVTDAALGTPMVGVRVQAYNNALYAAMTHEDGSYTISVPEWVTSLTFALEGCNTSMCSISGKTGNIDMQMYPDNFSEVYQTKTYGTKSKTMSVESMNNDINVETQMTNKLSGDLQIVTRSGQLGIGSLMYVAGINSLNINTQPLIVLDGVIMNMGYEEQAMHDGYFNDILSNIMVEDIESVTVLKNGLAVYGAKGANGVILINTKRNKSMATKIDVSLAGSYQMMPKQTPMMNASQYRTYVSEMLGGTSTQMTEFKFMQLDPNYYYYNTYHNDTDWSKEAYRQSFVQNYSINVQGGDEVANYNLSVGFGLGDATLRGNDFQRFNLRLNSDIILSDHVSVRFDAAYSDITRDLRDDGISADVDDATITAPGFLSTIKAPFLSPYAYDVNGNLSQYLSKNDDYLDEVLGEEVSLANPTAIIKNGDGTNKNYYGSRLIAISVTPKYEINRYWSVSEHFNYTLTNLDENYYLPMNGTPQFKVAGIGYVDNKVAAMASHHDNFMSNTYFNYDRRFNAHDVHVSGGFRYLNNTYSQTSMTGYNSGNDKTPNMSTNLQYKSTGGADDKDISLTYWAQGNYSYREKYYATVAVGLSSSSRFGGNVSNGIKMFGTPWGIFPSVAGSWVASSEPWFNVNFINYLKFNAGIDMTGNDGFSDTAARTYFAPVKLLNMTGLAVANIGNSSLQWETTTRNSFGLDANLFNNKVNVTANGYFSNTKNLLSISQLSYLTGVQQTWSNGGALKNTGFDVTVTGKVVNTKDLQVEVGASAGKYKNEITKLPDNDRSFTTSMYGANIMTQKGSPVGIFWGYETDGVYSTSAEAAADGLYIVDATGAKTYFKAGDVKFVNHSGSDKVINEKDMVQIGDATPDLYGRIFANLKYKAFTLSATMNYSLGNDIFNYQRMITEGGNRFMNQSVAMVNRWTCEGQNTVIPVATYGDPMQNSRFSDRWIEDGSYLKLKNITLSYKLPVRNEYIQGITVWGAANNLLTLTKYLGNDPEFSFSNNALTNGIDRGLLPQSTNISLGVKINL